MKKQMKLFTYMTKPIVLFALLLTIGVSEMWGTSRTFKSGQEIFFKDASGNITWGYLNCLWKISSGDIFAYFWNDTEEAWSSSASLASGEINKANAIYKITVPGSGKEFTKVVFTRHPNGVTPTWNNRWSQTTDQYPEESYNMFCISNDGDYDGSRDPTHKWKGTWDRYSTGALCGDFNNWDPDRGKFTSGRVILELEASTAYGFKVLKGDGTVLDNWYGLNSGNITNTTSSWWTLKSKENNCTVTSGEAGEYCFHWDGSSTLGVYYPQARFSASQYIYFNVEGETGWKDLGDKVMFWTKYYDSGGNNPDGGLSCNTPVETYVYYAQIPNHDYIGQVQLNRYDGSTYKASSAVAYAYNRTSSSQNCMIEESGNESATGNWTPQWTTYCPPTTSETFTDNSTTKISWQPDTNDGSTSGKAIWVKTGTTLKVTANASKAVADPNMTIKYDFKVNSTSQQDGTTASYTHSASTNNTTYELSADIYTNYNLDNTKNSTKHTQSSIFYKALDTYSVTHTLSGVTKASGREGTDAAAYYVAYDATYEANAGYYLPSDVTVTIGGATKTKGTDYTWTVTDGTSGALAILTDKIDGNVVVTINGVWRWSVAGSWKVITPGEGDPYWDADTYAMGTITKVSSDDVCSVEVTLSANTNYTFKIADRAANPYEYWGNNTSTFYMTYGNSSNWTFGNDASNTAACGLTTAGAGTYTFTYSITQHKVSVTYPESFQVTAAGNPAAGGTVAPASATYMSTEVGDEITATPNYSHYFNGWTSNAGGTFVTNTATATFKPSATSTVTAAFAERTAFIEGNFQVYNSDRSVRTKTGNAWQDASTTIKMTYDAGNNRYYLHTYSTPTELREQLNDAGAFFYVNTSTSSSSIADAATYKAYNSAAQSLSEYGSSHSLLVTTGESEHGFKFTGSEDGYVIIYFNGTSVWYELECALSYYGGEGATGDAPVSRTYCAYGSNQTAASNTYSKTGYTFANWNTASGGGGTTYAAGATNVAMDAHEVCLHAQWTAKEYTVTLEGMEADGGSEPIQVNVTYDAVLPSLETKHTKAHYDLRGYWAASDDEGKDLTVQLIDANGNWIPDVTGYTGNDGAGHPTWVHDFNISLFAQWTEHSYTVTTSVSPAGAGTLSCGSSVTAQWVTPSELITATANPAWKFVRWEYGENVGPATDTGSDNTVRINATVDGTLTAVFEPRFCLVGSIWDNSGNGGMPGWSDYTADFTVNSYTDLSTMNLTCVRSLDPNTTYKFEVHDKVKGKNFGYSVTSTFIADQSLLFNTQNNDVLLRVNGHGECTFTISALSSGDLYPTVSVAIPASHQLKLEWAYVRINGDWYKTNDAVGGTVSAQTTESGRHFTIHNDEYVAHGGDITYTATPATGYTFEGWYNNDYNTLFSTTNPYTSSNIQTTEKVEAKFVEKATAVTLSNDGHGHVEIGGVTVSSTTVGVTTTRELTAVPDEGYKFNSWTKVSGDDITLSSTSTNPTTLSGNGAGAAGQEVRANFDYRWALKAESVGWGHTEFNIENISTNASGDVVGYVDITLAANTNYEFTITDKQESQTYKNGSGRVFYMTNGNSHNWSFATDKTHNCGITTAGAGTYRFIWNITDKKMTVTYPNFVIYRTGDKAEDPRAQYTDAESYEGGTIEKAIEFRMKVQTIDQWYSLSLPFAVSSVKVWDDEDGAYYDIVPYYRTGGKFYTGHYIIRKPETVTNYAIETFEERWVDPENRGVLPEKNIPYIIQWHDPYFLGKYISFFGSTNQAIPSDFNAGEAPSADDVVNVFGNNTMHSGTVMDAYLLDKDYGPSGAWLREDIGTNRTIFPFECFIRASQQGTARYRIIRRGMEIDTPTALEQISNHQSPMTIRVYTITGVLIGEYNDCSFQDAAHRIATDHNEGIYILRSENESMKLLLGGK